MIPILSLQTRMEGTLPVSLSSFTARSKHNSVEVNWTTLSEKNNSHFILFASNDGQKWVEIKKIESKALNGSSTVAIDYNITVPLTGVSLAALGFLSLLLVPSSRNRFARFTVLLIVLASFISCAKDSQSSSDLDNFGKGNRKIYLKLVQYDRDGTATDLGLTSITKF